ncbi:J domain-containing protein [Kaistia soli]|uniref:J domain-containing protein n=1 Tax=Kaistia soli TaxID=446684 RepID=UPI00111471BA|nr:J domain-containing protein [Kaistia soli]
MRIATLYLLVVLFEQETDPSRTLGVPPGAPADLIQDHRKWLLKWLHPDRNANSNLAALSVRVLAASAALSGAGQTLPVPSIQAETVAAPVTADHPEQRRKHKFRHVWVPQRVEG